jgi:hypothetical protein
MKPNMNFADIFIRYMLLMITVIIGGALHCLPIMLFGMLFFFAGITGWSPLFAALGIDHDTREMNP